MDMREIGRKGGKSTSERKKDKARLNGRKGGRPRKPLPDGVDLAPQEEGAPSAALRSGYVLEPEYIERSTIEEDNWYDKHGTQPLPRIRYNRVAFRQTCIYRHLDLMMSLVPDYPMLTIEKIQDAGGGQITPRIAEAIYFDLKNKYRR